MNLRRIQNLVGDFCSKNLVLREECQFAKTNFQDRARFSLTVKKTFFGVDKKVDEKPCCATPKKYYWMFQHVPSFISIAEGKREVLSLVLHNNLLTIYMTHHMHRVGKAWQQNSWPMGPPTVRPNMKSMLPINLIFRQALFI